MFLIHSDIWQHFGALVRTLAQVQGETGAGREGSLDLGFLVDLNIQGRVRAVCHWFLCEGLVDARHNWIGC